MVWWPGWRTPTLTLKRAKLWRRRYVMPVNQAPAGPRLRSREPIRSNRRNSMNRFWLALAACLMAGTAPGFGQSVTVMPDIAIAEAEYRDATEAWIHNDPNLEADLFKGDKEQMRRRVRRAATLRDDVMTKKETYLNALLARLETIRGQLTGRLDSSMPIETMRRNLEAEQNHTLEEQKN